MDGYSGEIEDIEPVYDENCDSTARLLNRLTVEPASRTSYPLRISAIHQVSGLCFLVTFNSGFEGLVDFGVPDMKCFRDKMPVEDIVKFKIRISDGALMWPDWVLLPDDLLLVVVALKSPTLPVGVFNIQH